MLTDAIYVLLLLRDDAVARIESWISVATQNGCTSHTDTRERPASQTTIWHTLTLTSHHMSLFAVQTEEKRLWSVWSVLAESPW